MSKVVIITGATQGIGQAIAEVFLREGAHVVVNYASNEEKALIFQEKMQKYRHLFILHKADICLVEEREKLVQKCLDYFGDIDVLVNNAAIADRAPFSEATVPDTLKVFNLNLIAPFFISQRVSKEMIVRKKQGCILNISSIAAKQASPFVSYDASKAGLSMLGKSLAKELSPYSIRVNTIVPGLTMTENQKERYKDCPEALKKRIHPIPLKRAANPQEIADAVYYLSSEKAAYITGAELVIDGGWICYAPME